jgi:flagellar basal body rod protein FlgC
MQETSTGGVTANTTRNAPADSVDLTKEVVDMMVAEQGFKANVKMLKTAQETQKSVIDILA